MEEYLQTDELRYHIQAYRSGVRYCSVRCAPFSPPEGVGPEAERYLLRPREDFLGVSARATTPPTSNLGGQQQGLVPISVRPLDIFVNFIKCHRCSCHNCPCGHNLDPNFDLWTYTQPPWADRYLLDNFTMIDSEMAGLLEADGPKFKALPFMGILLYQMVERGKHVVWGTMDASMFVPKDHAQRQHFVFWLHSSRVRQLASTPKKKVQQELDRNAASLELRLPNVVAGHGRPYVPVSVHFRSLSLLQEPCARYPAAPNHFEHLAAVLCPPKLAPLRHIDL